MVTGYQNLSQMGNPGRPYRLSRDLCLSVFLHDFESHDVVLDEMVGESIADPGTSLSRTSLQQLVPCVLEGEGEGR